MHIFSKLPFLNKWIDIIIGFLISRQKAEYNCMADITEASETTATWKGSKYGVISGTYFPVFGTGCKCSKIVLRKISQAL